MTPVVRYGLARLGLLLGVFLLLLPLPWLSPLVTALLAVLVTVPLAWFLLRRWREQAALAVEAGLRRRQERRERLRAALAGDDQPEPPPDHP